MSISASPLVKRIVSSDRMFISGLTGTLSRVMKSLETLPDDRELQALESLHAQVSSNFILKASGLPVTMSNDNGDLEAAAAEEPGFWEGLYESVGNFWDNDQFINDSELAAGELAASAEDEQEEIDRQTRLAENEIGGDSGSNDVVSSLYDEDAASQTTEGITADGSVIPAQVDGTQGSQRIRISEESITGYQTLLTMIRSKILEVYRRSENRFISSLVLPVSIERHFAPNGHIGMYIDYHDKFFVKGMTRSAMQRYYEGIGLSMTEALRFECELHSRVPDNNLLEIIRIRRM